MPLKLDDGWNNIQLNLADLTKKAYGTNYVETLRVQVHANCRLRRIYFSDRLYSEEELPPEFKLYLPIQVRTLFMYFVIKYFFAAYLSTISFCELHRNHEIQGGMERLWSPGDIQQIIVGTPSAWPSCTFAFLRSPKASGCFY